MTVVCKYKGRMYMMKKIISVVVMMALMSMLLSGCGNKEDANDEI